MFGKDYAGDMIVERKAKRSVGVVLAIFGLYATLLAGFWGTVIWAAVHFIKKYW